MMKLAVIAGILLVFLFLVTAGCLSGPTSPAHVQTSTAPQEVRPHYIIGIDADFPPFSYQDNGGNFSGVDIDAARWIADREGFDVTFVAVPWYNVIDSLDAREIDIIYSGFTVTEERLARVNFSVPYYTVNQSIAVRAGSPVTMQDLSSGRLRIGVQAGSSGADWVNRTLIGTGKMKASNLSFFSDITTLTNTLEEGTIDASIIQTPSQKRAIQGRPLVILGSIPSQEAYAIAVRKNDTGLLARLDDGLMQLTKDPTGSS